MPTQMDYKNNLKKSNIRKICFKRVKSRCLNSVGFANVYQYWRMIEKYVQKVAVFYTFWGEILKHFHSNRERADHHKFLFS